LLSVTAESIPNVVTSPTDAPPVVKSLLLASVSCTVTVDVELPFATIGVGLAVICDVAPLGAPTITVTVAVCVIGVPPAIAETTLSPTAVEDSIPVATPNPFVGPLGCVSVFPAPVAVSDTVAPATGLSN
jgi:hypothetical protein